MKWLQMNENSLYVYAHTQFTLQDTYTYITTVCGAFHNGTSGQLIMSASPLSEQVPEMIESGYVHPPPPGCPRAVYKVMIQCW